MKNEHQNIESENSYSINELIFLINKYKITISSVFFLTLFLAIYFTLIAKPTYKSTAILMISENQKTMPILDMGMGKDRNYIENEIQILLSRSTSEEIVRKLSKSKYKNDLFLFGTKEYKSPYYRQMLTLGLLDKYQDVKTLNDTLNENEIRSYAKKIKSNLSVSNERNTDALKISMKSSNPHEAKLLLDTLISVYANQDLKWTTGEMRHLKTFLLDQLEQKDIVLKQSEEKLKSFQQEEKIFTLDRNSSLLLENLTQFETEYNELLALIEIIDEREKYFNKELTNDEKVLSENVTNTINDRLSALRIEMASIEGELISSRAQYGDSHSAVVSLKNKLTNIKKEVGEETELLISNGIFVADPILYRQSLMDSVISLRFLKSDLQSKAVSYKKLVDQYDKKLSKLPSKLLEYTRYERERSINAETYSFMMKKLDEARIGEASKLGKIRVIDYADLNKKPISPSKIKNLFLGIFLGLIFGVIVVFVIEFFDNTIKSLEQIERKGLSILSIIPSISSRGEDNKSLRKRYLKKNFDISKLQRRLITHEDPKSPISEAYRSLRTSLMYSKNEENCNFILVSSSGPGEGKTTTIANLAITYANLGKKTLLIDTDLRKSVLHKVFNIDKTPGLTSYLSSESKFNEIVKKTDIDNLDVVTSGITPPNPSELLDSKKMELAIKEIKKSYDIVLFDSPPLIAVTDAYVMMKYIDQFILVIRPGVTEKGALDRILAAIKQTNFSITGVVMNAISKEHSYGSAYYYNYYQYYYGDNKN